MSYLAREASSLSTDLWDQIDNTVVNTARKVLVGRRFLHIYGPLGIGTESIQIDHNDELEEVIQDGFITTKGRSYKEIPALYDDFMIFAKDLENSGKLGYPVDLSNAAYAAERCARKEDKFLFFGKEEYGYEGLMTAEGTNRIEKSDWSTGENAFSDIISALEKFSEHGIYGPYALTLSPDLYMQLQRLQPGTGLLEIDRISKIVNGNIFFSPVLGVGKAVLVCSDPRYMDLVIGQDLATAYLEQKDLNHSFRIMESILLRIKRRQAIAIFE